LRVSEDEEGITGVAAGDGRSVPKIGADFRGGGTGGAADGFDSTSGGSTLLPKIGVDFALAVGRGGAASIPVLDLGGGIEGTPAIGMVGGRGAAGSCEVFDLGGGKGIPASDPVRDLGGGRGGTESGADFTFGDGNGVGAISRGRVTDSEGGVTGGSSTSRREPVGGLLPWTGAGRPSGVIGRPGEGVTPAGGGETEPEGVFGSKKSSCTAGTVAGLGVSGALA
jgi:hypothetical protein